VTFALLRDAQATTGGVLTRPDSAAIGTASALPLIRLTAARDGRRRWTEH
jgi:hypothetical protein